MEQRATEQRDGLCIGGPYDGERISGLFQTDKIIVPVNPHPPSEAYRREHEKRWSDPCPDLIFDQVEYRWAEGAWYYSVH